MRQLRTLVNGLTSEGYVVHNIDYCGQGEPLDHPEFRKIVEILRESYPVAKQRVITNGNHDYAEKLSGVFLEDILVSIDGAKQNSYEQYRIDGDFEKAIRFTEEAKKSNSNQRVIWKYILFDHNDSLQEIELAEETAKKIGVDALQFVRTHSAGRSITWEDKALPLKWVNSVDTATPAVERETSD